VPRKREALSLNLIATKKASKKWEEKLEVWLKLEYQPREDGTLRERED
jgi:hypothetical protein